MREVYYNIYTENGKTFHGVSWPSRASADKAARSHIMKKPERKLNSRVRVIPKT